MVITINSAKEKKQEKTPSAFFFLAITPWDVSEGNGP
jgi:hypothetical protein